MKIRLLFALLFVSNIILAEKVDIATAEKVAKNFFYEKINQYKNVRYTDIEIKETLFEKDNNGNILLYCFNISNNGFVVVSAYNNVIPVVCYSFESNISNDNNNDGYRYWIELYKKHIAYAQKNQLTASSKIDSEWQHYSDSDISKLSISRSKAVVPLLTSQWNQDSYYNAMCPPDATGPNGHTYAGCVATAMGQIMYYHRWPLTGVGAHTSTDTTYGKLSVNYGNSTYDWNSMQNSIIAPNDSIAKLLYHIGVSVDMHYGPNGSGMTNHHAALSYRTYFKYCPQTQYVFRDSTTMNWDSILVANIDNKKPLYYAGWDPTDPLSGHAFVCDGYQGTNYYHFNFGWSGQSDGYYYTSSLTPSGCNFNNAQELIKDIYPDTINYTYPAYCTGNNVLNLSYGAISDESGIKNYNKNSYCTWLIKPEDVITKINFTFDKLSTQLNNDYIKVYAGADTNSTLLGTYSGSTIPSTISATTNSMYVVFKSDTDNVTGDGFHATYNVTYPVYCSGSVTHTAKSDTVTDGSGGNNYNNNTNCHWEIEPANATSISVHFINFELDSLNQDFVKIIDRISGATLAIYRGKNIPPDTTYNTSHILVIFTSNITLTGKGWTLYYYSYGTGVSEHSNIKAISVFPNPASNLLHVSFILNSGNTVKLQLINVTGQTVYENSLLENNSVFNKDINVSQLTKGVYTLRIMSEGGIINKEVVIQ